MGGIKGMGSAFETNNDFPTKSLHCPTMFIRLFALFFLFASFGASIAAPVPSATSVEISKRQESAVDILNTLKNSTDTILPKITTLVQGGNISGANVTSLITSLRTAIKTATSSLAPLSDYTDLNDVMTRIDNIAAKAQRAVAQVQAQARRAVAQDGDEDAQAV
ncbi:hypothetical protein BDP27DRAFT_1314241 [Rhodocollybia butyracea]|uniref:Uncharacterized protein n=1 Tax=Rhodocollybia butyracea TaxID=206335 RepID=A0A9P5Q9P8_9AGAR|nr:hypothetical protein BDP27DRAFT_1314241 [Rhodocollybia butyracea]